MCLFWNVFVQLMINPLRCYLVSLVYFDAGCGKYTYSVAGPVIMSHIRRSVCVQFQQTFVRNRYCSYTPCVWGSIVLMGTLKLRVCWSYLCLEIIRPFQVYIHATMHTPPALYIICIRRKIEILYYIICNSLFYIGISLFYIGITLFACGIFFKCLY